MNKSVKGFTIVELLIVIVIIAILAAITVVVYTGIQTRARNSQRVNDISQLTKALELYYADNGRYPSSGAYGSTAINPNWATTADDSWQSLANDLSAYMNQLPKDPVSITDAYPLTPGSHNYSYYSLGGYCNEAMNTNQAYLLVYELEGTSQVDTLVGDCSITPAGPFAGVSNYRVVK